MILLNNLLKRAAVQGEYDAWLLVPDKGRSRNMERGGGGGGLERGSGGSAPGKNFEH